MSISIKVTHNFLFFSFSCFFLGWGEAVTLNNHITSKELNKFNEVSSDAQHVHPVKVTFSN